MFFSEKNLSNCYHLVMDDHDAGKSMSDKPEHGWKWAYRKLRGLHCSRITAAYRATLHFIWGDTGFFYSDGSLQKIRLRRSID
ncbi:hypothetical protein [Pseudomonas fluorescens]|uniref:hypothetical protein n=1 Tax=Pseudomonas fluorescens TaxID=294 RepID=UPI00177A99E3|nr:hypothetical protein [Pseudomonas fluorescens]